MAEILYGRPVAEAITTELTERAAALTGSGVEPGLAIIRLGENNSDVAYEQAALKRCARIGIKVRPFHLRADAAQSELLSAIEEVNSDEAIHGCLMFRPLPGQLDERAACEALSPHKDVDGITGPSMEGVFSGTGHGFVPCTARSCLEILDYYGIPIQGKRAVVIGRSLVIGRPAAMLLLARDATVTICHSRTPALPDICREADILIAAAGRPGLVGAGCFNPGQVVIDVGINTTPGGICGDVCFEEAENRVRAVTPVPGGVGAVTTAVLCKHVIEAAERRLKQRN